MTIYNIIIIIIHVVIYFHPVVGPNYNCALFLTRALLFWYVNKLVLNHFEAGGARGGIKAKRKHFFNVESAYHA